MAEEKIGLYFVPANEGDFLTGLPARDLTEAEVAQFAARDPWLMAQATAPHPTTGKALYQSSAPKGAKPRGAKDTAPAEPDEGGE